MLRKIDFKKILFMTFVSFIIALNAWGADSNVVIWNSCERVMEYLKPNTLEEEKVKGIMKDKLIDIAKEQQKKGIMTNLKQENQNVSLEERLNMFQPAIQHYTSKAKEEAAQRILIHLYLKLSLPYDFLG